MIGFALASASRAARADDRDFAGKVEVMFPVPQTSIDHRLGREGVGSSTVQHDLHFTECLVHRCRIIKPKDAMLHAQLSGLGFDFFRIAPGDNRLETFLHRRRAITAPTKPVEPYNRKSDGIRYSPFQA